MPLETLQQQPSAGDYIPLLEHQAQTPDSFFGGKPILHAHLKNCNVLAAPKDIEAQETLKQLWLPANSANTSTEHATPVDGAATDSVRRMCVLQGVDVLVGSDSLVLSKVPDIAISIPYPSISLHAIQRLRADDSGAQVSYAAGLDDNHEPEHDRPLADGAADAATSDKIPRSAVYLQIDPLHHLRSQMNPDQDDVEDGDNDTITLYIVPTSNTSDAETLATSMNAEQAQLCFKALSDCADLHPDELDDEEEAEAGGLGGMLGGNIGEGGWITAENAHEFADAFAGEDEGGAGEVILGPGAGSRRTREDEGAPTNGDHGDALIGNGDSHDETKWRRTD